MHQLSWAMFSADLLSCGTSATLINEIKEKYGYRSFTKKTIIEWTQPDDWKAGGSFERKLGEGTFALQGHDPGSTVLFRNLMVKRLP